MFQCLGVGQVVLQQMPVAPARRGVGACKPRCQGLAVLGGEPQQAHVDQRHIPRGAARRRQALGQFAAQQPQRQAGVADFTEGLATLVEPLESLEKALHQPFEAIAQHLFLDHPISHLQFSPSAQRRDLHPHAGAFMAADAIPQHRAVGAVKAGVEGAAQLRQRGEWGEATLPAPHIQQHRLPHAVVRQCLGGGHHEGAGKLAQRLADADVQGAGITGRTAGGERLIEHFAQQVQRCAVDQVQALLQPHLISQGLALQHQVQHRVAMPGLGLFIPERALIEARDLLLDVVMQLRHSRLPVLLQDHPLTEGFGLGRRVSAVQQAQQAVFVAPHRVLAGAHRQARGQGIEADLRRAALLVPAQEALQGPTQVRTTHACAAVGLYVGDQRGQSLLRGRVAADAQPGQVDAQGTGQFVVPLQVQQATGAVAHGVASNQGHRGKAERHRLAEASIKQVSTPTQGQALPQPGLIVAIEQRGQLELQLGQGGKLMELARQPWHVHHLLAVLGAGGIGDMQRTANGHPGLALPSPYQLAHLHLGPGPAGQGAILGRGGVEQTLDQVEPGLGQLVQLVGDKRLVRQQAAVQRPPLRRARMPGAVRQLRPILVGGRLHLRA